MYLTLYELNKQKGLQTDRKDTKQTQRSLKTNRKAPEQVQETNSVTMHQQKDNLTCLSVFISFFIFKCVRPPTKQKLHD